MPQAELLLFTDGKTAVQREEELFNLADDIFVKFTAVLASMCKASSG